MSFLGGKILSANLIEKKILSLKWAKKNSVSTLCLKKTFVQKKICQVVAKKNLCCTEVRKIYFESEKNHSPL